MSPATSRKSRWSLPRASIGTYLIALALAIALPMLAFIVLILWQLQTNENEALRLRTEREAEVVARTAANQLRDMSVTLRLLASAPELAAENLGEFHSRTKTALQQNHWFLIVVQQNGQQLMNTRVPFGTTLGVTSNMASLNAVLQSKRPDVSNAFFGQTSGRWVFNVIYPLSASMPSRAAALILTQNVEDIAQMFEGRRLPAGWHAALLDKSGHVVAATDGTPPGSPFRHYAASQFTDWTGSFVDTSSSERVVGYTHLPEWSWRAVVWGPAAAAQEHFQTVWRTLLAGGILLVITTIIAALVVGRYLRRSIVNISDMANSMGRGEIVSPIRSNIIEADNVGTAISDASYDRSLAEDRIHLIVRELSHRTSNLITVIQAMMRQSAKESESLDAFQASMAGRLKGLSQSIELLTAQQWSTVSMRSLLERQMETIVDDQSRFALIGENFQVTPDAVQSLGMIFHELATNATKYGALSTPDGKIIIQWIEDATSPEQRMLLLTWSEVGKPKPSSGDHKGFGSRLIEATTASLAGSAHADKLPGGWKWTIKAPWDKVAIASAPKPRHGDKGATDRVASVELTAKPVGGH